MNANDEPGSLPRVSPRERLQFGSLRIGSPKVHTDAFICHLMDDGEKRRTYYIAIYIYLLISP